MKAELSHNNKFNAANGNCTKLKRWKSYQWLFIPKWKTPNGKELSIVCFFLPLKQMRAAGTMLLIQIVYVYELVGSYDSCLCSCFVKRVAISCVLLFFNYFFLLKESWVIVDSEFQIAYFALEANSTVVVILSRLLPVVVKISC